jgi:hypothetical protein
VPEQRESRTRIVLLSDGGGWASIADGSRDRDDGLVRYGLLGSVVARGSKVGAILCRIRNTSRLGNNGDNYRKHKDCGAVLEDAKRDVRHCKFLETAPFKCLMVRPYLVLPTTA